MVRAYQRKNQGHEHEGSPLTFLEFSELMKDLNKKTADLDQKNGLVFAVYNGYIYDGYAYRYAEEEETVDELKPLLVLRFTRAYSSNKIAKLLNASSIKQFSFHKERKNPYGGDFTWDRTNDGKGGDPLVMDWKSGEETSIPSNYDFRRRDQQPG